MDGVVVVDLTWHADDRGSVAEVYRQSWLPGPGGVVQANLSISLPGVLRGLHFHREQSDYWIPVTGTAFVGLFDLRRGSPTAGAKAELRIGDEARRALFIPPGVAHGFYAESDLRLLYFVDAYYTGKDEFGVAWDDPEVGIDWPSREPVLSERDRANPALQEIPLPPTFRT
ncbi:MAG TPA: dTDP-4-dehydrorhamnose 3,5-epimerase family protein [Actinomycetota bacterium]|nr:dTDP-4-dehydrorhamnose 3,5-epimerase family protein [Actinomycetota bacterium]